LVINIFMKSFIVVVLIFLSILFFGFHSVMETYASNVNVINPTVQTDNKTGGILKAQLIQKENKVQELNKSF
jgi:hypothetical protein